MTATRRSTRSIFFLKHSMKWHKKVSWVGGIALIMFAFSGMLHPIMSWTGPKAAVFYPPQVETSSADVNAIPAILARHGIEHAVMTKIVPAQAGAILQVTQSNSGPRDYYDLETGEMLPGYDEIQARWLARYYTGLAEAPIKSVDFLTEFGADYAWVNRLLPVYRVTFDVEDGRTAFIYTELGVLASLTNNYKTRIQSIFRALHTWDWLASWSFGRVGLMLILLLCLLAMALTGTALVFLLSSRRMPLRRKVHRLFAYAIWLPILGFTTSGIYHLLYQEVWATPAGLRLGPPISFSGNNHATGKKLTSNIEWPSDLQDVPINKLSLIAGPDNRLLYRVSLPAGKSTDAVSRVQRFRGKPDTRKALFINAYSGQKVDLTDKGLAIYYAQNLIKRKDFDENDVVKVTGFGPEYDFRNKRIPVWRIDYKDTPPMTAFIDPATGVVVDSITASQKPERYSFSFLHKWNFITPITGRFWRDCLVVFVLSLTLISAILGYVMLIRRRP